MFPMPAKAAQHRAGGHKVVIDTPVKGQLALENP